MPENQNIKQKQYCNKFNKDFQKIFFKLKKNYIKKESRWNHFKKKKKKKSCQEVSKPKPVVSGVLGLLDTCLPEYSCPASRWLVVGSVALATLPPCSKRLQGTFSWPPQGHLTMKILRSVRQEAYSGIIALLSEVILDLSLLKNCDLYTVTKKLCVFHELRSSFSVLPYFLFIHSFHWLSNAFESLTVLVTRGSTTNKSAMEIPCFKKDGP